ncbi:MAG: hypothetical protein QNI97_05945, partial [Desulfobacterales bacterium]|nr:hypothetical protein [Desulfobacterales bacterium]
DQRGKAFHVAKQDGNLAALTFQFFVLADDFLGDSLGQVALQFLQFFIERNRLGLIRCKLGKFATAVIAEIGPLGVIISTRRALDRHKRGKPLFVT